jgi:hypothetical protein
MLTLLWNLSAAIRGYLRFYMPTNRAVDWLRTQRGLKWALPLALISAFAYLCAMRFCAISVERGGPGYLNVLVLLFAWNFMKFACTAVLAPFLHLARYVGAVRSTRVAPR